MPLSANLHEVARTFVQLQQARHEADYDLLRTFTREEVDAFVRQVESAFFRWKAVKASSEGDVFMVALLAHSQIKGG